MTIDVSKLKAGDQYYNEEEGWVQISNVELTPFGNYRIFDVDGQSLAVRLDGSDIDEDDGWSITKAEVKEQPSDQEIHSKITSDGGSSSYYLFPQSIVDLVIKTGKLETKDIIRHGFGNDNDFGNVFKALKRLYELKLGGGKDGSTAEYEVNKMKYFLNEILENVQ